jgi:hypothetical protein
VKPLGQFASQPTKYWQPDSKVYVQLQPQAVEGVPGITQEYVAVSLSDQPVPGEINLQGLIRSYWQDNNNPYLLMHYGINALFVQEGHGRQIERDIRDNVPVFGQVAVTASGKARLKNLFVNGKPVLEP